MCVKVYACVCVRVGVGACVCVCVCVCAWMGVGQSCSWMGGFMGLPFQGQTFCVHGDKRNQSKGGVAGNEDGVA